VVAGGQRRRPYSVNPGRVVDRQKKDADWAIRAAIRTDDQVAARISYGGL